MFLCGGLNLSCDAALHQTLKYVWEIFLPPAVAGSFDSLSATHKIYQQLASGPCWVETVNWPCGVGVVLVTAL